MSELPKIDLDSLETQEWLESMDSILENEGPDRAHFILEKLIDRARRSGTHLPFEAKTAYVNTIPPGQEPNMPGDQTIEARIRAAIRWNALVLVLRASKKDLDLGGHIGSFASSAMLYDVGFNHFFRAASEKDGGDFIFAQGHISPGIYARAFMEGRLTESQMDNFRQECDGKGLSSYPHPHLMKDFWQFPTVSMGLGPLQAIYTARFLKYLTDRGIKDCSAQRVYCYLGDGETDEPESLGAIGLASREGLDNLTFVINCNLQRLDGPVRGNGKIIQELEGTFRGAGWEVVKVIWGSYWDALIARDTSGKLLQLMEETVDGEYQNCKAKGGKYTRENFFNKYPETAALVANMSDEDIYRLNRGGHDPVKVYAAYKKAIETKGRPTVILAKTVKGFGLGASGEALNVAHNVKKMDVESIKLYRDRFNMPINDDEIADLPFYRFPEDSEEFKYMKARREALGGSLPARRVQADETLEIPSLKVFDAILKGSGDREVSSTMTFVRVLNALLKDKKIGKRIVPIIPDEARTFGMEGLFRQVGIYANEGQKYIPQDADQVAYYREDKKGQVLQEGINELGAMASWVAAGTSYSTCNATTIPFYIYYSMFGFQRVGDLAWAAGDSQAKGFLLGATAGRTTLNGEGLQHQDGHSHVQAGLIPNCVTYDPTYGYEISVIVREGLRRMYEENENIFFYLTLMNENYKHPAMPENKNVEEQIIKGIYKLETVAAKKASKKPKVNVQLMGSGTILEKVREAAQILSADYGISSDVYSVTSFNELARDGQDVARWNMLHPESKQKQAYISNVITKENGPAIAATDYIKNYSEQVRAYIDTEYRCLGTDGFGRSDSRANLRTHFEVNAAYIVVAALFELANRGDVERSVVTEAIKRFDIDTEKLNPLYA
ncbi:MULTISPECIES: pyruvate dehydrogenase (acetyl-transferring), homodimeric type [unclassified Colwellia]|jgi:pyruvate dehydrogenase E1 component|uniref:pyruvate dehydrogenase (acetyl-transferring), homodimeric type n=1 Tax=unclassified Colwellia TaxID=196834 RepID=UPI0015F58885|nr:MULTISPECIES: pyruvate dehydrogenase (acetyl-transferring), homodimeric type [unclassified Colwellia]MBA6362477.1 pyruvate dehydrogenase (acetyl-transferring), homodimeric type [Colwellia sp. BRX8-8]MBA6336947.1 pyruvate dehydrogenase (acetyl-transferring), homodimeric type [Colwellia sp. BRX8-7]MBA6348181.1 pyruvate dehydrogenase (acetyl-transferring), homodimeric type [Colwellia sp. BRX8-9]MBA6351363.1 pyruvate dehydrogenase (acetyl-transferring), homodimeric type [Colwellia sp. BRX9-1]MB|tara:strand:- start:695 stop:3382 length:2688 start_codon:yes stop_codon:yes gene_type:complete